MPSFQEEVSSFLQRIAQAEARRDAWKAAGNHEKYLEAYFDVEGLELLLEQHRRQHAAAAPVAPQAPRVDEPPRARSAEAMSAHRGAEPGVDGF